MSSPARFRQSYLASFEVCPRRSKYDLEIPEDLSVGNVGASADLGTMVHAVFGKMLAEMRKNGERNMPTEEAMQIMRAVYMTHPIVLPAEERDLLRGFTLQFCGFDIDARRILALEEELQSAIMCDDGVTRVLTGHPDLVLADPPHGLIVVDWKSGRGKPRTPREMPAEGEPIVGKEYLSDRGHFQGDSYGLQALDRWPAARYCKFREYHLRSNTIREVTLTREELEHVRWELGAHMQKMDEALKDDGSDLWQPRAGRQCVRACPVAASCPIPAEMRGVGALETPELADEAAARKVVVEAVNKQLRDNLVAVFEETGRAPVVGDGREFRWEPTVSGGRKFGAFPIGETAE